MAVCTPKRMSKVVENYILQTVIGSGQFGDVYKAKRVDAEEYYAVKTIKLDKFTNTPKLHDMTKNEVEILGKINNPNVIKLYKVLKTANNIYLIYELCTGGNLEQLLDIRKFIPEKEAVDIFRQLLNGCRTIVDLKILHRDFKPSNILFHNGTVKIADFGFCKVLNSSFDATETMVGSPIYMAPEILKGQVYNMKADIYSLGVLFYETLYGVCPFEDTNIPGLLNQISKGNLIFHQYNPISKPLEDLIRKMLDPSNVTRIEWEDLFAYFFGVSGGNTPTTTTSKQEEKSFPNPQPLENQSNGLNDRPEEDISNKAAQEAENPFQGIIDYITAERKKLSNYWELNKAIYANVMNEKTVVIFFLINKKMFFQAKQLHDKILMNTGEKTFKNYDMFKMSPNFKNIISILQEEKTEFLNLYKSSEVLVRKLEEFNSTPIHINLKLELNNEYTLNEKYLNDSILNYAKELELMKQNSSSKDVSKLSGIIRDLKALTGN